MITGPPWNVAKSLESYPSDRKWNVGFRNIIRCQGTINGLILFLTLLEQSTAFEAFETKFESGCKLSFKNKTPLEIRTFLEMFKVSEMESESMSWYLPDAFNITGTTGEVIRIIQTIAVCFIQDHRSVTCKPIS